MFKWLLVLFSKNTNVAGRDIHIGVSPEAFADAQEKLLKLGIEHAQAKVIIQSFAFAINSDLNPVEKDKLLKKMIAGFCATVNQTESVDSQAIYAQDEEVKGLTVKVLDSLFSADFQKAKKILSSIINYTAARKSKTEYRTMAIEASNALASLNRMLLNNIEAGGYSQFAGTLMGEQKGYEVEVMRYLEEAAIHFYEKGQYREAIILYERLVAMTEQYLPNNLLNLARHLNNFSQMYFAQGRYEDAEHLLQRALTIRGKSLGENHPSIATTLNNLALLYYAQDRYDDALPLYQRALEIDEKFYGNEHPAIASDLHNLAVLCYSLNLYEQALRLYYRVLDIRGKQLGINNPEIAKILNNIAVVYTEQGLWSQALSLYERALTIKEKQLGENHPDVAETLNNLAALHKKQGQYAKASPLYQRALDIYEKALGFEHPYTKVVAENLGELQQKLAQKNLPQFKLKY